MVDALPGRGGVVQEVAPAVLPCTRGGVSGTAFDVVAGAQAGSVQVALLGSAPAECAAGCPAVDGSGAVLLRDDPTGTEVAVPGPQGWVLLQQELTNLSGLDPLTQLPFTAAELAAAGRAVLAAG
ncbi:hypothetical protein JL107_14090 [Nakamurella flavida]|uniref:Uncharacterized protein n=1 Tax=Nakamurella flavida TaxID=363630 RepID=A0A938YKD2_9ACTN|nr:hypothetical protein [Nakamurella flavida]MBM9477577.1 hypothetical protein [Nakamurella flavida]